MPWDEVTGRISREVAGFTDEQFGYPETKESQNDYTPAQLEFAPLSNFLFLGVVRKHEEYTAVLENHEGTSSFSPSIELLHYTALEMSVRYPGFGREEGDVPSDTINA